MRCYPPVTVETADRSDQAAIFRALGDAHRLTILATLARSDDEVCVCDFTSALPLNQPTVSHHLKILRDTNLVTSERRGTWVYYRLAGDARERIESAVGSLLPEKALA